MNTKTLMAAAAALAMSLLSTGHAVAGEATPDKPYKADGTSEQRKAERAEKRKEMADANKKGDKAAAGEATPDKPVQVAGTHDQRKADRAAKRKEMAAANKNGEVKAPNEAGEPKK